MRESGKRAAVSRRIAEMVSRTFDLVKKTWVAKWCISKGMVVFCVMVLLALTLVNASERGRKETKGGETESTVQFVWRSKSKHPMIPSPRPSIPRSMRWDKSLPFVNLPPAQHQPARSVDIVHVMMRMTMTTMRQGLYRGGEEDEERERERELAVYKAGLTPCGWV